jgi:hypothetical protein
MTAARTTMKPPTNANVGIEVLWRGLLAETGNGRRKFVEAGLLATLSLQTEGRGRVCAEVRCNGSTRTLIDESVRVEQTVRDGWTCYDVFRDEERLLVVSISADEQPLYVRSTLPEMAGLSAGRLEPPTVRRLDAGEQES